MTQDEFNALCRSIRKKNVRIDPHEERELPMMFQSMKYSLEETWRYCRKHQKRNPDDSLDNRFTDFWDKEARRFKAGIRLGNADDIYRALITDPQKHILNLGIYVQHFQLACVSTYLHRKIPFHSYPTVMSLNFD